jgi:hypothetical protein
MEGGQIRAQPLGRGVRNVEPQTQRAVVGLFEILVLKSDNGQPSAQSWSPAFFEARGSRTCASHILGTISSPQGHALRLRVDAAAASRRQEEGNR